MVSIEPQVIDNFFHPLLFEEIQNRIVFNSHFPLYINTNVVSDDSEQYSLHEENWNFYYIHLLYNKNCPTSDFFREVSDLILPKFNESCDMKSLIRMKVNFYPHTETLREHGQHRDATYSHKAAILSLNTCDGFTRMEDGTKIDSVANRLVIFDGINLHNSSTTTNAKGRYNININFL